MKAVVLQVTQNILAGTTLNRNSANPTTGRARENGRDLDLD